MKLIKKFRRAQDDDYEHKSSIVGSLRLVLKALDKGLIPHKQYGKDDLLGLCQSFIDLQGEDGSWRVHLDNDQPSEEDLVDFVYFPTQIACSILSWVKQNMTFHQMEGLDAALTNGLEFSVNKDLKGFGFNGDFQSLESLIIFSEGDVPTLLNKDPRICPPLYERILELKGEILKKLEGGAVMPFGGDYTETYEFVLQGLAAL